MLDMIANAGPEIAALTSASLLFLITSCLHATINSKNPAPSKRDKVLLRLHYAATFIFLGAVGVYGWNSRPFIWVDVTCIAVAITMVHAIRGGLDWIALKDVAWRPYCERLAMDTLGNLITIAMALMATDREEKLPLAIAVTFGAMFIAKELVFRMGNDFSLGNKKPDRPTRLEMTEPTLQLQAFFGRFLKSYFYIVVGFAIIFAVLAKFLPKLKMLSASGSADADLPLNALWFSLTNMSANFPSELPSIVMVVVIIQFVVSMIMNILVATTIIGSVRKPTAMPADLTASGQ